MLDKFRRSIATPWMDQREYLANVLGLRIVVGAVLGFVLPGTYTFAPFDFGVPRLIAIGAVVSILYISASRRRLAYTALALGYALLLPVAVLRIIRAHSPEKLAPTLPIWTLFQAAIEFTPRAPSTRKRPQ